MARAVTAVLLQNSIRQLYQPLAVGILPKRAWCFLVWEGVDNLLDRPLGVGIGRHAEVGKPPSVVTENDEDVQSTGLLRRKGLQSL